MLKAALATNCAPAKVQLTAMKVQKKTTRSTVRPAARNVSASSWRNMKSSSDVASVEIVANRRASLRAPRTRSNFRAPKFCPMIGPTDPDSEKMMPKATGTSRLMMATAATASSPKGAAVRVM